MSSRSKLQEQSQQSPTFSSFSPFPDKYRIRPADAGRPETG
jgi:hypothetical protein